ncbi:MAG: thioredoxin family protein [Gemmataceae bacterium]|nr:thioredoxin family protein [Gemmataceae bacterium]
MKRLLAAFVQSQPSPSGKRPAPPAGGGIQWFATLESAQAEAKRTERPILLVSAAPRCAGVSGIWRPGKQEMDRSFLSRPEVVKASRSHVCGRLATYEDEVEGFFLWSLAKTGSGKLENSVFAILAPDLYFPQNSESKVVFA